MKPLFLLFAFLLYLQSVAQQEQKISSPDGNILFTLRLRNSILEYKVDYKKQPLINYSSLSVQTEGVDLKNNLKWQAPAFLDSIENYILLTGKNKNVIHRYRQMAVRLNQRKNSLAAYDFIVNVFNDGVAFRYSFPKNTSTDSLILLEENSTFNVAGDPTIRALLLPNYTTSHEGLYTVTPFSKLTPDTLADMPLLVEYGNNTCMAITEAALLDYAGMYLMKKGNVLVSMLSPLPEQNIKIKAALPHQSPWRVMLIGSMTTLMESNILTTLSPPQKQGDWSWLRPGTSTFPWWNGNVLPDTINAPGNNFVTQQYYIDFCARNNITYHSVVEYGLHQWYVDDGTNFQPGPNADVTKAVPGLDMKQVCDYAHSKGVGVRVWVHWAALYPKLDSAFAIFERWGLSGMMVDFMDRDDQKMVNMQTEILEKAAKHKLHIQFHGAYKPTGLLRTYPNEVTREGTLNYEVNKWDKKVTPDHDLNILFTRALAGPTDYHLGGFRAVPDSLFKVQYTRPLMMGTRAHALAMYLVFDGALQMVCDYPGAYEGQPGFSFLQNLPTTWDETKWLIAVPDSYAVVARRKGSSWYVGAINNSKAKEIQLPLNFLSEGIFAAESFTDGSGDPNNFIIKTSEVNKAATINLKMAAGGGGVMVFKKK